MRRKIIRGMLARAVAVLAAAGCGLFLPTPASAGPPCSAYAAVYCFDWEERGFASEDECMQYALPMYCPFYYGGALEPTFRVD